MNDLNHRYVELNNSYDKKLVFHVGAEAGFFSEYNNMVFAMLYCLKHKIRFVLYSRDANFRFKKGWNDYFMPFSKEYKSLVSGKLNTRENPSRFYLLRNIAPIYKKIFNIDYFTYDLWSEFYNRALEEEYFDIPELSIKGSFRDACRDIVKMTWKYNPQTLKYIQEQKKGLNLPEEYVAIHVRRGDKYTECKHTDIDKYFEKAEKETHIRYAFLSTDDYTVYEEAKERFPNWEIQTLTSKEERGYVHAKYLKKTKQEKNNEFLSFLASVEIMSQSSLFIGTFSSNIGIFLGVKMDINKCLDVNDDEWHIW